MAATVGDWQLGKAQITNKFKLYAKLKVTQLLNTFNLCIFTRAEKWQLREFPLLPLLTAALTRVRALSSIEAQLVGTHLHNIQLLRT